MRKIIMSNKKLKKDKEYLLIISVNLLLLFPNLSISQSKKVMKNDVIQSKTFVDNVNYSEITFLKDVNFSGSKFKKNAIFYFCHFYGNSCFDAEFSGTAKFQYCTFEEETRFDGMYNNISLDNSIFKKSFDMYRFLIEESPVSFNSVSFLDEAVIERVSFPKETDFSGATIKSKLSFIDDVFNEKLDFSKIKLSENSQITFENVGLPFHLDFSENPKIYNEIDLSTYTYKNNKGFTLINLYNTDISKIKLDYQKFRLDLVDKSRNELTKDGPIPIYEGLLKNFKEHGQLESYKLLDIEYQQYKDNSFHKFKSKIEKWWWNFGYNRENVFKNSLIFLMFFMIVNFFFLNYLNKEVYSIDSVPIIRNNRRFLISNLMSRFWYSLVYTSLIFFTLSLKLNKLKFGNLLVIYVILIYLFGIISLAYMANFVLQK